MPSWYDKLHELCREDAVYIQADLLHRLGLISYRVLEDARYASDMVFLARLNES